MLGFMAPAANANGVIPKPFTMTVSPSTSPAGASTQFTVTVKNWWVQKLGSVDLSVPAAYSITGVAHLTRHGHRRRQHREAAEPEPRLPALVHGQGHGDRGVLAEHGQRLVGGGEDGRRLHRIVVPAGHAADLSHDGRDGRLLARVHHGRQPADTGPDATISSVASDPDGPPLQVGIYDGANN